MPCLRNIPLINTIDQLRTKILIYINNIIHVQLVIILIFFKHGLSKEFMNL